MNRNFFILVFSLAIYFFSLQNTFSSSSNDENDDDIHRFDRYYLAARGMLKIKDFQFLYTKIISNTKTASNLANLPLEMIIKIASYLSPSEFNSLKKIDKYFYEIVKGNNNLLYKNYLKFHYSYYNYKNHQSNKETIEDKINKYFKTSEDFKGSTLFNYEPFKSWILEFYKIRVGVIIGPDSSLFEELNLYFNYLSFIKKRKFLNRIEIEMKNREALVLEKLGPPSRDKILRQFLIVEKKFHNNLINNTLIKLELIENQNDGFINPYWKFKLLYYKGKFNKAINYLATINKNLDHDPEILYLRFKDSIDKKNKRGERPQDYLQSLAETNFIQWKQNLCSEMFPININVQKDYLSWYINSCRHRISQAQYYFGQVFYFGSYKKLQTLQNLNQATGWYFKSAKNGHAKAQLALNKIYTDECQIIRNSLKDRQFLSKSTASQLQLESTVKKTDRELDFELSEKELDGIKWLSAAARQGLAEAQYQYGFNYKYGNHIFKNLNKAKKWFSLSAEQGYAKAQYEMGLIQESNKNVLPYQNLLALWWFEQAAKQGHKDAQFKLEIAHNIKLAEENNVEALYKLALLYSRGDKLVRKDNSVAYNYLISAANLGNLMALYELGTWYEKGYNVKQDMQTALSIYDELIKLKFSRAQCKLAKIHEHGLDNKQKALKLYEEVDAIHDHNYPYYIGKALYHLSKVNNDKETSKQYNSRICKAAEHDYTKAQYILAKEDSDEHLIHRRRSIKPLEKLYEAAENRNRKARYYLGRMYADGTGIEQNHTIAAEWYLKSAQQGYAKAQYELGKMYEKGLGVKRDYRIAAKWYHKAAEQGDAEARSCLKALYAEGLVTEMQGNYRSRKTIKPQPIGFLWKNPQKCSF